MTDRHGNLFCISGPSGAGKGTLVARLVEEVEDIWLSVSATTRKPRPGEVDGVSYFFLSDAEFDKLIEEDGFLEWANVHDRRYGTPLAAVREHMDTGEQVVLEIEPQGAAQVRSKIPEVHLIFIAPPSMEVLRQRLEGRGTEDAYQIELRLKTAELEMERKEEYDVVIVNDDLEVAVQELVDCINRFATE